MTIVKLKQDTGPDVEINLRDPVLAALLGWIWPGAGHLYQKRHAKAMLYMVCIVGTFLFGMGLGRGRVVYASTRKNDFRWQFYFQLGAGGLALPAVFQAYKVQNGGRPFFPLAYRYPAGYRDAQGFLKEFQIIDDPAERQSLGDDVLIDGLYAPPAGAINEQRNDVLGMWHFEMNQMFDIGTLFTLVAGLLNILVIYDAFAGPFVVPPEELERRRRRHQKRGAESS